MFHNMPQAILDRMRELEQIDVLDRAGGTARMKRLRQIPPEVGRFIALLAAAAPDGRCIEIGTSAGYSTLWLALSCRAKGRKVTTFEVQDEKAKLARTTFDDDAAYAAMDFLLDALPEIAERIFASTANLLNLSCDIIFVDTSSTYFERDVADGEIRSEEHT